MKFAFLDINTGTFSNAHDVHNIELIFDSEDLKEMNSRGIKLIKFECVNDPKFEFTNHMKLK